MIFLRCARVCTLAIVAGLVVVLVGCGTADAEAHFSVTKDGFSISNAPGYCFAMAVFSRWYYLTKPESPPLRSALARKTQERIAGELQQYYSKHLIGVQAEYCNRYRDDQTESFRRFIVGLMMGEPRLVLLMNKTRQGAVLHAVLAYQWLPDRNKLKIYDPNYSDEERFLDLNRREYTSLDILYNAICFPEVLDDHESLVRKMENLYSRYVPAARADSEEKREARARPR
ncbi:MAG: hypothetical protein V2B18_09755 [Pseudomonadota bacterium]